MQRTVPHTASDPITLFMRTYYSLLRTTDAVPIQSLVESYQAMRSSLHTFARETTVDVSALVYAGLRLPASMPQVETILMGQTIDVFEKNGFSVRDWERVSSPGRRRRMHWNGNDMLAVFLSSRSDVDDLLPMLTAYQIEWNKIHQQLRASPLREKLAQYDFLSDFDENSLRALATELGTPVSELQRLAGAWGQYFVPNLRAMAAGRKHILIRRLAGSLADYRKATALWWANLREIGKPQGYDLEGAPVYFVSSNLHALSNLFSGFAVRERESILEFLHESRHQDLLEEYENVQDDDDISSSNEPNFLYYAAKKFLSERPDAESRKHEAEQQVGVLEIPARHGFDVGAQLLHLNRLSENLLDPRLCGIPDFDLLERSDALIMNIDYPLGLSAYELLSHVSSRVGRLAGVYIMGKAATLNGRIGDVMIPNVIHDEHSQNTYLFNNVFHAGHIAPYMSLGSVLDNQKAITAYGTFLQNAQYMDIFYEEGYTILEMEAGPYLSAVYESVRPRRHPTNEIIRLYEALLDVGIVHYASDTPFSKGQNLGAGSLGYAGVEPTYAAAIAIARRIMRLEIERMKLPDRGVTHLFSTQFAL